MQPSAQPKKKSNLALVLLTILVILMVPLGVIVWRLYTQPMGPGLETASPTDTTAPQSQSTDTLTPPAPTATTVEVCGETGIWNVLVLGSDAADLYYPQGSDLIRVVRVDFPNRAVTVFSFSRDLWVDTASLGLTNPAVNATRLGMVYHEARIRSTKSNPKDVMLDGVNATAKALGQNFGLNSDHYVALDIVQVPAMIDAIGGLPINIPADLTDPLTKMEFKAGQQTLTGQQAAVYARAFLGSDLERIQRNNLVIEALRQRLLDPGVWINLPQLFVKFQNAVLTDFSPEQVNHLICLLREVPREAIVQDGIRAEWTNPGPEGSLLWDRERLVGRLRELNLIP